MYIHLDNHMDDAGNTMNKYFTKRFEKSTLSKISFEKNLFSQVKSKIIHNMTILYDLIQNKTQEHFSLLFINN